MASLPVRELLADVESGTVDSPYLLGQNGPQPSVRGICLQNKREGEVRCEEQRLPTESFLYLHKCCLALLRPLDQIWGTFSGEISQGAGQVREPWNEPVVVTCQPQEPSHLLFGLGAWVGCSGCCLLYLWTHPPALQVLPQMLYLPSSNCTLLRVGREPHLPHGLQNRGHPLHMLSPGVTVDDNIIQVGGSICSMQPQHPVHKVLKGGGGSEKANRSVTNWYNLYGVEKAVFP